MTRWDRTGVLWLAVVSLLVVGCRPARPMNENAEQWRLLKVGSLTRTASALSSDEAYLLQLEGEAEAWTERHGLAVPTDGVDFATHTVVVLVRPYATFEPMIKAVAVTGASARIVLADNIAKPNPVPALPVGMEVRQYLVVQVPKVDEVIAFAEASPP